MKAEDIITQIEAETNPEKAKHLQYFFKTGKGQYAEGDLFLGLAVPQTRAIVKQTEKLPLEEIGKLLDSPYHEIRLAGLLLLVKQYKAAKKDKIEQQAVYEFYVENARKANNWDLVDLTCRDIIGMHLLDKEEERNILYTLIKSENLWEQRIAIVSTWAFIKQHQFDDTFALSLQIMDHKHDLMHKAMGWMLREVGKMDRGALVQFLEIHRKNMPRTALRYAIEHFDQEQRTYFMGK